MAETPWAGRDGSPPAGRDGDGGQVPSPGARAQQARSLHDHGRYSDKIPVNDPAMSPLGTDSEAAGQSVPEGAQETVSPTASPEATAAMDAPAANNRRPAGHARGEVPRGATPWIWVLGSLLLILGAGLAALAALD
ncbi:hypothetical protein [Oleisolibacter albus]|uniref:hypothetical protein n=1 Tax=Oleisolibacter albus TaxID=2171757 RepID=UPI000DF40729|nr:hypothetical protein [Oleisolibacter albus]